MPKDIIISQSPQLENYIQSIIDYQKCYLFDKTNIQEKTDAQHVMNREKVMIQAGLIDYTKYINEKYPVKLFTINDEDKEKNDKLKELKEEEIESDIDSLAMEMSNWFELSSDVAKYNARQILSGESTILKDEVARNNVAPFVSFMLKKAEKTQQEQERGLENDEIYKSLNPNYVPLISYPILKMDRMIKEGNEAKSLKLSNKAKEDISNFLGADEELKNEVEKVEPESKDYFEEFSKTIDIADKFISKSKNYTGRETDIIEINKNKVLFTMDAIYSYGKNAQEETKKQDKEELSNLLLNKIGAKGNKESNKLFAESFADQMLDGNYSKLNKNDNPELISYVTKHFDVLSNFFKEKLGKEKVDQISKDLNFSLSSILTNNIAIGNDGSNMINDLSEEVDPVKIEREKTIQQLDDFVKTTDRMVNVLSQSIEDIANTNNKVDNIVNKIIEDKKNGIETDIEIKTLEVKDFIKETNKIAKEIIDEKKQNAENEFLREYAKKPLIEGSDFSGKIDELDLDIYTMQEVNKHNQFYSEDDINNVKDKKNSIIAAKNLIDPIDISNIFGTLTGGDEEYYERVKMAIGAIANGEKLFGNLQDVYPIEDYEDKYTYATKMVLDVLKVKNSTFEDLQVGQRQIFMFKVKKELENVSAHEIKENIKSYDALNKLDSYFRDCNTPAQRKDRFSQLIDRVQSGSLRIPTISNEEAATKDCRNTGKIASYFIKLMSDSKRDIASFYGLNKQSIKDICDSKLDASLTAQEMETRFHNGYGKRNFNQLSEAERLHYNTALVEGNPTGLSKLAEKKMDGLTTNKSDPLITDALAAYARLSEIHSKRGMFFWLTSPLKNWDEYSALKNCEKVLKDRFGFTKADFTDIKNTYKDFSVDAINAAGVYVENKKQYNNLFDGSDDRKMQRDNKLEKLANGLQPQNVIDENKDAPINIEQNNQPERTELLKDTTEQLKSNNEYLKEVEKNRINKEFEIDTSSHQNNIQNQENNIENNLEKKDININIPSKSIK